MNIKNIAFAFLLMGLQYTAIAQSMNGTYTDLNYLYDYQIFILDDQVIKVIDQCNNIKDAKITISENAYKSSYIEQVDYGDGLESEENGLVSKTFKVSKANTANFQTANISTSTGDNYTIAKTQNGDDPVVLQFWKSKKGHFYFYQLFSEKSLSQTEVDKILDEFLHSANIKRPKDLVLSLKQTYEKKYQDLIKLASK